jgi:hypothetical protein
MRVPQTWSVRTRSGSDGIKKIPSFDVRQALAWRNLAETKEALIKARLKTAFTPSRFGRGLGEGRSYGKGEKQIACGAVFQPARDLFLGIDS